MHRKQRHTQLRIILVLVFIAAIGGGIVLARQLSYTVPRPSSSPVTPSKPTESAFTCTQKLPEAVKIGQKLMVAGYNELLPDETSALANNSVEGIILMDETSENAITTFKKAFSIAPLIAVDQEGGTVQRYTSEGVVPGATDMAALYSPDQAYTYYLNDDTYLQSLGITTNFSPVVDVMSASPSSLPGRMYSSDPSVVTSYATQSIKAASKAGITPVVKHFPGLGSTSQNTDFGSATTDPLVTLETRDVLPYQQLAQYHPDAMVSNAIVPGLTDGEPAVWSSAAVNLLRSYGYKNAVIYTDSLTAQAIPGELYAAVIKAWQAGIDVALVVQHRQDTTSFLSYLSTIVASAQAALDSGSLNQHDFDTSVMRILARKNINPCSLKLTH